MHFRHFQSPIPVSNPSPSHNEISQPLRCRLLCYRCGTGLLCLPPTLLGLLRVFCIAWRQAGSGAVTATPHLGGNLGLLSREPTPMSPAANPVGPQQLLSRVSSQGLSCRHRVTLQVGEGCDVHECLYTACIF